MAKFDVKSYHRGPGDEYHGRTDRPNELATVSNDPMDSDQARSLLRRLLEWFYFEKDIQSTNRYEMAVDHDFYDGMQWDPEDKQILMDRGQSALVYNEIAPMVDWLIGTERRSRVDWDVLPRTEDDVEMADVKKKVMKWHADINRVQFVRSRAFADAVKGGVGWIDDGVRDDPTKEPFYSKYEDWRNVLWDSRGSYELDIQDGRYLFRWRWVDEDIAIAMFPKRADAIRRAAEDYLHTHLEDDDLGIYADIDPYGAQRSGALQSMSVGMMVDAKRRRVRLIECQYYDPMTVKVVDNGPLRGAIFDPRDQALAHHVAMGGHSIIDKVAMRLHVAVFTEADMLHFGPTLYRHNRFSLTPIWCYRRSRDRLPYGPIRRVRDLQQDLNKRASKALHLLNTNQIIMDEDAVEDVDEAADEAARPDGRIIKRRGAEFEIRRDNGQADGQIAMMTLATQSIQRSVGVADENLGRQTNAISGEAIKARQLQGSVVTTEPFDNLRYGIQTQGEKVLSLLEQFLSEEKVIRLTGHKGALEWVKVNQPETQVDGSVRYINDITASMADFQVAEQDYAGTLRAAMFDSLTKVAERQVPELALRLMTLAFDFSDFPNKDDIVNEFRKITGERDPNKPPTPEENQAAEDQAALQAEAIENQRAAGRLALEEQAAKIREINARAAKAESEAQAAGQGMNPEQDRSMLRARAALDDEIERLQGELVRAQAEARDQIMQIRTDADTKVEVARIQEAAKLQVAEIQAQSNERIARIQAAMRAKAVDNRENAEGARGAD